MSDQVVAIEPGKLNPLNPVPYSLFNPGILQDRLHQCSVIIRQTLTTDFSVGAPFPSRQNRDIGLTASHHKNLMQKP
jgi:hypothetical protein